MAQRAISGVTQSLWMTLSSECVTCVSCRQQGTRSTARPVSLLSDPITPAPLPSRGPTIPVLTGRSQSRLTTSMYYSHILIYMFFIYVITTIKNLKCKKSFWKTIKFVGVFLDNCLLVFGSNDHKNMILILSYTYVYCVQLLF